MIFHTLFQTWCKKSITLFQTSLRMALICVLRRVSNSLFYAVMPRPNNRSIVGCNMLHAFGHPVAICWNMLGVVGSNLTIINLSQQHPTSQHITTRWPNAHNMFCPTMLRYVALTCCNRLSKALKRYQQRVASNSCQQYSYDIACLVLFTIELECSCMVVPEMVVLVY